MLCSANNIIANESGDVKKEVILSGTVGIKEGQIGFKILSSDPSYAATPTAIAVDNKGNIYIADIANDRIQKFDMNGKYINKIDFTVKDKLFYTTIDDMNVDNNDNLYVASRHESKIIKYNPIGKQIGSINLDDKEIYWKEGKGWSSGSVQIEKIFLDDIGNIYLQGVHELIKFDIKGNIQKKWGDIQLAFLDEASNLYLAKENLWEKYNKIGNMIETLKCEKPLFRMAEYGQCLPPQYIDKKGFLYFYEFYGSGLTTKGNDRLIKVDRSGKRYGEYYGGGVTGANRDKFDANGNLYFFLYKDDKFWVEKISWLN